VKKLKLQLLKEFDYLDIKQESNSLSQQEKMRMEAISSDLESLWKLEKIQRSRDRKILESGRNTTYFQAVANQRNRKKRISGLESPEGWIDDNGSMLKHALSFYKSLFREEEESGVELGSDFWEVKEAMFRSYAEGAPGPDGFSFLFYQVFWDLIKKDLMCLVNCFEQNQLNLERLNFAMITLLPKEPVAKTLKKYRPISLINCSFKFFGKLLNNKLVSVANRLIASNQTAVTPSVLPRVTTHQSIYKHHDCVILHEKNKFIATKNDPRE
jgi:hypothetical protein